MSHDRSFYWSKQWRQTRRAFLAAHPMCAVEGCQNRATDIDHIKSRKSGGDPYDWNNLRQYCHPHHSAITVRFDGGFGNPLSDIKHTYKPAVAGCDAQGKPSDPNHPWYRP